MMNLIYGILMLITLGLSPTAAATGYLGQDIEIEQEERKGHGTAASHCGNGHCRPDVSPVERNANTVTPNRAATYIDADKKPSPGTSKGGIEDI